MDAAITNNSTETRFIPGPNIELESGQTKTWPNITLADLDSNEVIKTGIVAGDFSVSVTPDTLDAALIDQSGRLGLTDAGMLPSYTVAELALITGVDGRVAYASNGRAGSEGAGAGTGTPVVYTNSEWRRLEDLAIVAA